MKHSDAHEVEIIQSFSTFDLKRQCDEMLTLGIFIHRLPLGPPINTLKCFRFLFRIRWEVYEHVFGQRYAAKRWPNTKNFNKMVPRYAT
jgi:hypothetical protein